MNMAKKLDSKKVFEIVWYSLCGAVALWGLTYIVLGLVAGELMIHSSKNVLLQASNAIKEVFGLGFFYWGLIILTVATVAAVIVLLVFAKRVDRDFEKTQRRAARRTLSQQEEVVAEVNE
jgi:hypothetical protein